MLTRTSRSKIVKFEIYIGGSNVRNIYRDYIRDSALTNQLTFKFT